MSLMDIDENSVESEAAPEKMGDETAVVEYKKSVSSMGRSFSMKIWLLTIQTTLKLFFLSLVVYRDDLIQFLDSIDNRVEELRKEAIKLQDQRDLLLTRIDMLKNTDLLTNLSEADQEEVSTQLKRINERLQVRSLRHAKKTEYIFPFRLSTFLFKLFVTYPKLIPWTLSTIWSTKLSVLVIQSASVKSVKDISTRAALNSTTP